MIIHGWQRGTERLRKAVRDEKSFAAYHKAVTHTACGKLIYGKWPMAVGPAKDVTCVKCKKIGTA